jgi:hypothetical protein
VHCVTHRNGFAWHLTQHNGQGLDHSMGLSSIEVTYEIQVFLKGAQKEVFSSILKKSL